MPYNHPTDTFMSVRLNQIRESQNIYGTIQYALNPVCTKNCLTIDSEQNKLSHLARLSPDLPFTF